MLGKAPGSSEALSDVAFVAQDAPLPSRMRVRDVVALARGAVGHSPAIQGMIPAAAGVFAVATGIASGVLLRRTLPAMAATIAIFVVVRLTIGSQVRPHFATAETLDVAFDGASPLPGACAWVLSERTLTAGGRELGTGGSLNLGNLADLCPGFDVGPGAFPDHTAVDQCLAEVGVHQIIRYHPADRFWTFQLIET